MPGQLRFRQVHLDFHTSEKIARIGADFDPDEFAGTLDKARVNSVTCFARGHHGYIYYETKENPERKHPHLERDLLREQIDACHGRDIRVPIYTTVQWDHYTAEYHPEWLCISEEGKQQGTPPYQAGFYRRLCLNSPYTEFLRNHVREILSTMPVDGLFFDIVQHNDCSCHRCRRDMAGAGVDPADPHQRRSFGTKVVDGFKKNMTSFVRSINADCTIFYNSGHIGPVLRPSASAYTHFELESLPSGSWGYTHFPLSARYARTLGLECMGMTGKFHTSWGDFHSFKSGAALEFECFLMLALNAKCSIGDQLHPEGRICTATYDLIGGVYSQVEEKEPWCRGARPVTEIGLLTPEEFTGVRQPDATVGAMRILQQGAHQFDILDSRSGFEGYRLLILPDEIPVNPELGEKVEDYLRAGGRVIASHRSGLWEGSFALESLCVELLGEAPFSPDFVLPEGSIGVGLPGIEHVMYMRGLEVRPTDGAKILADTVIPYFNRDHRHFCSHKHTPSSGKRAYPAVVGTENTIYFAHPILAQYASNAPLWCKRLFLNAVEALLPDPILHLRAPSTTIATVNEQPSQARHVLHLLHYIPQRRGKDFDTIEDVIPIQDVKASLRVGKDISHVRLAPQGQDIEFTTKDNRTEFVVPELRGHQMIELSHE